MKKHNRLSKKEALLRLMKLCSHSEKSAFEIEKKLNAWGLQKEAQEIIDQLRKENFLSDTRYVKAFIHDKIFLNKWGRLKVKYLLLKNGISSGIIENELNSLDMESYQNMIYDELNKKRATLKKYSFQTLKTRLYAFGNQRGYETNFIRIFIEKSDT